MEKKSEITLKISASKDEGYVKKVAGAMSWQLREAGFFKVRAVKQDAVSTATKAIAICNQRVAAAGIVLCVELLFSEAENDNNSKVAVATAIEMLVRETDASRPEVFLDYKVSGKQDQDKNAPMKLSEAIAAPVREGKGVSMRCIGPAAVYRAMMASTMARGLIFPNGFEAVVIPSWDTIVSDSKSENEKTISLIKLDFWGKKVS